MAQEGYNPKTSQEKADEIYDNLLSIFEKSEKDNISTHQAAIQIAKYQIENKINKRSVPPNFHCH